MKTMMLTLSVLVALVAAPQAPASGMWLLVQVDAAGQVLSNLGVFSSNEACLMQLAKGKAAGVKGLECRPLSGSSTPPQQQPPLPQQATTRNDDRGCPLSWNATRQEWVRTSDAVCSEWKWVQENQNLPGPWYLTALSSRSTEKHLTSVRCISRRLDGSCVVYEREFSVTTTSNYSLLGTFDTAAKCSAAKMQASTSGAECTRSYVPVRYEQGRETETLQP
jgi:hypothetical protein